MRHLRSHRPRATATPDEDDDRGAHRRLHNARACERHVAAADPVDHPAGRPDPHHDEGRPADTRGVVPGAGRLGDRVRHRFAEQQQPQAVVPDGDRGAEDGCCPDSDPGRRSPTPTETCDDGDHRPQRRPDPRRPRGLHQTGSHRVQRPAGTGDGRVGRSGDGHASKLARPERHDQLGHHARRDQSRREHPNRRQATLLRIAVRRGPWRHSRTPRSHFAYEQASPGGSFLEGRSAWW